MAEFSTPRGQEGVPPSSLGELFFIAKTSRTEEPPSDSALPHIGDDENMEEAEPEAAKAETEGPATSSQTQLQGAKQDAPLGETTSNPSRPPRPKPTKLPITVSKPTPYTLDLGHLLILDPNPLPLPTTEVTLSSTARDAAQSLLNALLTDCPIAASSTGVHITLPAPTTPLPREKPLPAAKKGPTKWEAFAAKKGITKKRRDERTKTVYDEAKGEWVPKWGYKGRNREEEGNWLVEVDEKKEAAGGEKGAGADDVRGDKRKKRKEEGRKNEGRRKANDLRGRRVRASR